AVGRHGRAGEPSGRRLENLVRNECVREMDLSDRIARARIERGLDLLVLRDRAVLEGTGERDQLLGAHQGNLVVVDLEISLRRKYLLGELVLVARRRRVGERDGAPDKLVDDDTRQIGGVEES